MVTLCIVRLLDVMLDGCLLKEEIKENNIIYHTD